MKILPQFPFFPFESYVDLEPFEVLSVPLTAGWLPEVLVCALYPPFAV
jgi:hypothetical protein